MMQKKVAEEVIKTALADSEFRSKLKIDPVETLKAQGLSPELSEDISRELKLDGVALSAICSWTCSWTGFTLK